MGKIVLLCGPSGAGKSSLAYDSGSERYFSLQLIQRTTTRQPRYLAVHEAEYEFVTASSFLNDIARGCFAEHSELGGSFYGVRNAIFNQAITTGSGVMVLICGVSAALRLAARYPHATSVAFVYPQTRSAMLRCDFRLDGRLADILRGRLRMRNEMSVVSSAKPTDIEVRVIRGLSRTAMIVNAVREGAAITVIENVDGGLQDARIALASHIQTLGEDAHHVVF